MIENVTISKGIAVLPGPRISFLDHLMPLCYFWKIPLLCTDSWVYTCAHTFYPPNPIILVGHENFQQILADYQTFITVEPCRLYLHAMQFGEFLYKGEGHSIAGFHGNPIKYREQYWIERYVNEDCVLLYGQYLVDYFKEKKAWERLKRKIIIGNVRKKYYDENKIFFDSVAKPLLFTSRNRTTVFWAPTWNFPQWPDFTKVLENIPSDVQILVKLHPFMFRLYPQEIEFLKEKYSDNESILFLDEIPLIYPLIEATDVFLGDYSSIAFDFLSLNRPLFLIGKNAYNWATTIKNFADLPLMIKQKDTLSNARQIAYSHVFSCDN